MATWSNRVTLAAARNGTTTHTVHPDGTGGTAVDGATFSPTSGRLLVCFVDASVTSTTPTGWTLPGSGSAVGNSGVYVFHRTADGSDNSGGLSADRVATTHNASNFPAVFDFYEFLAGSTFVSSASATGVAAAGGAGPTLSGLTGSNWTAGIFGQTNTTGGANTVTWDLGTEEVDTSVIDDGATDGYTYSLTYTADNVSATAAYAATCTYTPITGERLVVAVAAASAPSEPGILITFTKVL